MDEENGSRIELNVGLKRFLVSAGLLLEILRVDLDLFGRKSAVKASVSLTQSSEYKEFNDRPVYIEQHGTSKGDTNIREPAAIKIGKSSLSR